MNLFVGIVEAIFTFAAPDVWTQRVQPVLGCKKVGAKFTPKQHVFVLLLLN